MAVKLAKGNAPKVTTVIDPALEKIAVVREIRDMHLATITDGETGKPLPITASDDFVWNYYRQVKDSHPELSGKKLIAQVVDEIPADGGFGDTGPTPDNVNDAPAWTRTAAASINQHEGFMVAAAELIKAKEIVSRGAIPMYYDLLSLDPKVDFLSWAQPGCMSEHNTAYCDQKGKYRFGRDNPWIVNETNARIPMDTFRRNAGGKQEQASSYKYLAMQTNYGKAILEELNEYRKGFRDGQLGGPYGKFAEAGVSPVECKREYELRDSRLTQLASKLRTIKELDNQWNAVKTLHVTNKDGKETLTVRPDFVTMQSHDKDGNIVYVLDDSTTKPLRLVDAISGETKEHVGYSTFLNYDVDKAQKNGGTLGALLTSGKVTKGAKTPDDKQTGGGDKVDAIQIVNVTTEMAAQYALGMDNYLDKQRSTATHALGKPANQDMLTSFMDVFEELRSVLGSLAPAIDKLKGWEPGTAHDNIYGKLPKSVTKAA